VVGVWGLLGLLRGRGGRVFSEDDVIRVARSAPALISALRGYVTAGSLMPAGSAPAPGVIIVGPDHAERAATLAAGPPAPVCVRRRPRGGLPTAVPHRAVDRVSRAATRR
jgi:hypothetical protein